MAELKVLVKHRTEGERYRLKDVRRASQKG